MFGAILDQIDAEDPEDRRDRISETAENFDLDPGTVEVLDHATREMLLYLQDAKAEDLEQIKKNNPSAGPFLSILSNDLLPEKVAIALSKDPETLAQVVRALDKLLETEGVYRDLDLDEPNIGRLYPEHLAENDRPE